MARPKHLKKSNEFPNFTNKNHEVTSDEDALYNCIAFAAGYTDRKIWPTFYPDWFWPRDVPNVNTIDAFVRLFEKYGYTLCADGGYNEGKEKVAIWAKQDGSPTHAARQIGPKKWKSKLGDWYDIDHIEKAVSGGAYGQPVIFMERNVDG